MQISKKITHKNGIKVVFMGKYQNGKSLVINCLFGKHLCKTGEGLETTKEISSVGFIGNVEIFDCCGFGGNLMTKEESIKEAKKYNCVIFVSKGTQLDKIEIDFLNGLHKAEIPHSILFNVENIKYDENDEKETERIVKTILYQTKEIGDSIIPILDSEILCVKPHFFPNVNKLTNHKIWISKEIIPDKEKSGILQLRKFFGKPKCSYLNLTHYLATYNNIKNSVNKFWGKQPFTKNKLSNTKEDKKIKKLEDAIKEHSLTEILKTLNKQFLKLNKDIVRK